MPELRHQGLFILLSISPGPTGSVAEWGYCLKKSLGTQFSGSPGNWVQKSPGVPGCPSRDPHGGFEDPLEESAGGKVLSASFGSSS